MKNTLHATILLIILAIFTAPTAFAQDATVTDDDVTTNVNAACCDKSVRAARTCVNRARRNLGRVRSALGSDFVTEARSDLATLRASCGDEDAQESRCESQCRTIRGASDGQGFGFRYKHSEISGAGVVALTNEFSGKARFLADNCRLVETTFYSGVANGNRHHYYSSRNKAGIETLEGMAAKARRVGSSSRGYFQVGSLCYGPFNLGEEQD